MLLLLCLRLLHYSFMLQVLIGKGRSYSGRLFSPAARDKYVTSEASRTPNLVRPIKLFPEIVLTFRSHLLTIVPISSIVRLLPSRLLEYSSSQFDILHFAHWEKPSVLHSLAHGVHTSHVSVMFTSTFTCIFDAS